MKDFNWSKFSASSSPSTIISDCLVFFPVLELLESAMTWQHHLQHSYVPSLPDCREALENLTQVWARGSKNKITQQEYRFFFSFFLKNGTIQASLATSEHMGISHATSFFTSYPSWSYFTLSSSYWWLAAPAPVLLCLCEATIASNDADCSGHKATGHSIIPPFSKAQKKKKCF